MGNIEVGWDVEGIITPEESVSGMIKVLETKGIQHSGTFWTWENKVNIPSFNLRFLTNPVTPSGILGSTRAVLQN